MADSKLSALTAITSADGADEVYLNDGGASKKMTVANLALSTYQRLTDASATTSANATDVFPIIEAGVVKKIQTTAMTQTLNARPPLVNQQSGTTYTFVDADAGAVVEFSNASGCTATIPASGLTAPINSFINLLAMASGQVTVAAGSGQTLNQPATFAVKLKEQYSMGALYKQAASTWIMTGHMSAA